MASFIFLILSSIFPIAMAPVSNNNKYECVKSFIDLKNEQIMAINRRLVPQPISERYE